MRRKALSIILGITTVVAMLMGGCGGGGSSSGSAAKVVSGTASSGAAFSGSVVLKDARGRQLSMNTTTGAFSFEVTALTAPFILKAGTLYSIATMEGTTNINPFTSVIAKSAAGSSINIDTVFANVSSNRLNLTTISTNLPQAISNFNTSMNQKNSSGISIYTKYGMTSPPDFIHGKITIDQDVDKLFADINVTVTGTTVSVTNKSGATLMTGTYSVSGSTVSFVFTPNYTNIGAMIGSTTPPVTTAGVSISPTSASVSTGGSKSFTGAVSGASNTSVTWSVVETGGGSVTASGVYTAPSTAGTYHVKATSVADTTKSATATVTVTAAPVASGAFPIGTWVGPNGFKFTVSQLVSSGLLNQYSGIIYYPSLSGGSMNVSGTDSMVQIIVAIYDPLNNASLSVAGGQVAGLNYTEFSVVLNGSPVSGTLSGYMSVTSSNSVYNYNNMNAVFTKQ